MKVIRQRTDKLIRQQSNYIPWSSVIRMSVPHVSDWCPFNPQSRITSHRNNKKSCCCINISVWLWVLKKQGNFLNSIISIVYSGFWFFADGLDRCGFRLEAVGGGHCEIWQSGRYIITYQHPTPDPHPGKSSLATSRTFVWILWTFSDEQILWHFMFCASSPNTVFLQ